MNSSFQYNFIQYLIVYIFIFWNTNAFSKEVSYTARPRESGPLPKMTLVNIPAGQFLMGSDYARTVACDNGIPPKNISISSSEIEEYCTKHGPSKWFEDESPRHHVVIPKSFWISDTEVTVAQFREFISDTNYITLAKRTGSSLGEGSQTSTLTTFSPTKSSWSEPWPGATNIDNHPVVHIAWEDAIAFCQWLSLTTGQNYRLPTEAEWEYAALGGDESPHQGAFSWGKSPPANKGLGNIADLNFNKRYPNWKYPTLAKHDDGFPMTAPVRSYKPNNWGLYDMSGNVWEWTEDTYLANVYKQRSKKEITLNPTYKIFGQGVFHTMRGGAFDFELPFIRVQKRRTLAAVRRENSVYSSISVGFRVVKSQELN